MKNNLRELRQKADYTQEELADRLNVSRQTIISIESERYNPSLQLAMKISEIFKIRVDEIFIYEKEE